ncbi:probable disease resistance protein At4g33300 [Ipomoea triloba]|uniref:probable disease resistance protein At4g33300 n=1 Tax=Ipomoea triloba TaxID=35885 RepID=UPI00125DD88F|nr:probable disease resistance protein At4g33300 [Ipomoea triloba]
MAVTDLFAGEIATELLKHLYAICKKCALSRTSALQLIEDISAVDPIIREIKATGVELPQERQRQLDEFSRTLSAGVELADKVLKCGRWNMYKNLQFARKMEKLEKRVSRFVQGIMPAHVMADVHHVRVDTEQRFDRLDNSFKRIEQQLGAMKIGVDEGGGGGGWLGEAVKRVEEEQRWCEDSFVNLGAGFELGKRKVKDMLMKDEENSGVFELCGIGGSGKTTLAREICKDDEIQSFFKGRVHFLTVSQSPNVENLRLQVWSMISGCTLQSSANMFPGWNPQFDWNRMPAQPRLLILDDVWKLADLKPLIDLKVPGCKILVVSRFKFPLSVIDSAHELELLREDEAMSLFCHFAFGRNCIPLGFDEKLVKEVIDECEGLPLALKVVGSSLKGQPEMFWKSAQNRLSRSLPVGESHEVQLLERMKWSIDYLPEKVRECFLDLGAFPEDKKIPLDVLINMWVELHDIPEEEAFHIVVELSNKNLLNLTKDARVGDLYSSYYDISVSQHDVLRDLAIHMSGLEDINQRRRLLMPKRERELPKEWERKADQPFNARVISVHTDEMKEMDWFQMDCPKAEVLILNFSSSEYFLPPFICSMPKLRALILINYSTSNAVLYNLSVFNDLTYLRSLWFEKISVPHLSNSTRPLIYLRKISLILCSINNSLDQSVVDLPRLFPRLSELTMDHCINFNELPTGICKMRSLKTLSVTNCDSLHELTGELGELSFLQILRIYACPNVKSLPPSIGDLVSLKYLDISQCVSLKTLPETIDGCRRLEKIDMRECPVIKSLPASVKYLESLRRVICDEEVSFHWKEVEEAVSGLCVQVAEECFTLDWLSE